MRERLAPQDIRTPTGRRLQWAKLGCSNESKRTHVRLAMSTKHDVFRNVAPMRQGARDDVGHFGRHETYNLTRVRMKGEAQPGCHSATPGVLI
jgi:hypothetical protein